jgi:iron complex outermembrane receptor protein
MGRIILKTLLLGAASAGALSVSAAPALAQEAEARRVQEVVVTAQRREQAAQDVPIALTAVSGAALAEKGAITVNALERVVPGLEVESQFGSGQPSFSIRGIGFRDYATNNAPTVGVYVDEVSYPYPVMTQGVLFDIDRVEVLRGPQGTLYGRNTTGGAINIFSNQPTDEFEAGFTAEIGNYDSFRAEGFLSGPFSEAVAGRLAFTTAQGGAWQVNRETQAELGDKDIFAVRGILEIDVSDALELYINLHGYRDQSDGLGQRLFKNLAAITPTPRHASQRLTGWGASPIFAAANGFRQDQKPFRDNEGFGGNLRAELEVGDLELIYIGAHETLDRREYNDFDGVRAGIAGTYFISDIAVTSHELRIQPDDPSETFNWVAGVFYGSEELDELYRSDFGASFGDGFSDVRTPYSQEVQTLGVFGQADLQIAPKARLTIGLRYEDEDRDLKNLGTFANCCGTLNFANGSTTGRRENRSISMQEWSGRLGIDYRFSDTVLGFASISRGVKSGGFTAYNTLDSRAVDPFKNEEVIAYEAGFKSDLLNDTLRLNGAVFFYDYRDQQIQTSILATNPVAIVGRIGNVPKSEIWGWELEAVFAPADGLTITQALGYKEGEFSEFREINTAVPIAQQPAFVNRAGESLGLPGWSYSGEIAYTGALSENYAWRGSVDWSYRDETLPPLLKLLGGPTYTVPSYWLVNAAVAFSREGTPWELGLWARNLADEDYDETRNFFAGPDVSPIAAPGMPRTFGLRVSYTR